MFFAGAPLLSAILELPCPRGGDCPYPLTVGLCGSFASNLARRPLAPLPAPDDPSEAMLCLLVREGP